MAHFRNFKTVVYIPEGIARELTLEKLKSDYEFLEKYMGLDKVYLETYRGTIVDADQINMIKTFLESKGVEVSGGITTVYNDNNYIDGKQRLFGTVCYTDEVMREKIKEVSAYTAKFFDEIILDDFYFTNCTCENCIKTKGDKSWLDFRRNLMTEVSEELILKPAKEVNPNVKITIKYPNWRESYHGTGYLPGVQSNMFDRIYTGTETRSPKYTDQHLPEYLSYAIMPWVENSRPGYNGGGWLDTYQCWSTDRYLEQAYLTAFAKPREIMFFMWKDLIDNKFTTALGLQLTKIDNSLSEVGKPVGVYAYIPFDSEGENHLEMRLGMQGIPVEMTPVFPDTDKAIFFTESSLKDTDVVEKIKSHVIKGGTAIVTSGFVSKVDKDKWSELSDVKITGRKNMVDRYMITDNDADHIEHVSPVLFPDVQHDNNASWSLLNGGSEDYHSTIFIKTSYGKGKIYTFAIPDNHSDLKVIPELAWNQIKKIINFDGLYISGNNVSLFQYNNDTFFLYKYVKDEIHPVRVKIFMQSPAISITDLNNGNTYELKKVTSRFDFNEVTEYVTEVMLEPGNYKAFRINR